MKYAYIIASVTLSDDIPESFVKYKSNEKIHHTVVRISLKFLWTRA